MSYNKSNSVDQRRRELEEEHRELQQYKQLLKAKFLELRKKEAELRQKEIALDNREFELRTSERDLSWRADDLKHREATVERLQRKLRQRREQSLQKVNHERQQKAQEIRKIDDALKETNEAIKVVKRAADKITKSAAVKEQSNFNSKSKPEILHGHASEDRAAKQVTYKEDKALQEIDNVLKEDTERWVLSTKRCVSGAKYNEYICCEDDAPHDLKDFIKNIKPAIYRKLLQELNGKNGVKFQIQIKVQMEKYEASNDAMVYQYPYFVSKTEEVLSKTDMITKVDNAFVKILVSLGNYSRGSGWSPRIVEEMILKTIPFEPFKLENPVPSSQRRVVKTKVSGSSHIPTPDWIYKKKAVVNVENMNDDRCFRWAIKSALFPASEQVNRPSKYPSDSDDKLDFTGIEFPVKVKSIPSFERQNNLAINVFRLDETRICPLYISKQEKGVKRIHLLLLEDNADYLYTWIKDLNKFLYCQKTNNGKWHYCDFCITSCYSTEKELQDHKKVCNGRDLPAVRIEMPKEANNIVRFKNLKNKMPVPFVIYADFECINEKIQTAIPSSDRSNTTHVQKHRASAFCYVVVRSDGHVYDPVEYRGSNAAAAFLESVQATERNIRNTFNRQPLKLTEAEEASFRADTHCHICNGEFNPFVNGKDKVRDHDHVTGKFRGAAHPQCNLSWSIVLDYMQIPVFFHNLRGYDAHLIMQEIYGSVGKIKCLANNSERYICFSIGGLQFLDSIQFLNCSLERLAAGTDSFPILEKKGNVGNKFNNWPEKVKLLTRKGVYPYDYVDSLEKYDDPLPAKDAFYNQLTRSAISNEDYQHALNVYREFGCQNMGHYCDLYCRTDVLLLADIFENYRKVTRKTYKLDPARYMSSPGVAWDALLMKSEVELELLTDYDQLMMIENGLRGGISMVSKRFA